MYRLDDATDYGPDPGSREAAKARGVTAPTSLVEERASPEHDGQPVIRVTPTPPPERLGAEMPWDESSRPTYPAPADAAYTEAQQAYPQHLVDIHDALRSELVI